MRKVTLAQVGLVILVIAITCAMDYTMLMDPFRDGKVRYALLGAFLLAAWVMRRANPYAAAFAGYGATLWVYGDMSSFGILDTLMPYVMFGIAWACTQKFSMEGFARIIAHIALFQAAYGLLQIAGVEPWLTVAPKGNSGVEFRGTAIGTLGHYVMLTPFVALGLVYFLERKKWLRAAVCGLVIALSPSTMGVLCAFAGVWYLLFRRIPKTMAGAGTLALVGIGVWYYLEPYGGWLDFNGRLFIWPYVVKVWLQAPWFGHGPGAWSGLYPIWEVPGDLEWRSAHSDLLQVLPEYGIVGLAIVALGLFHAMVKAQELPAFLGGWLCVILVNCSANFIMHLAAFGLPAAWLLVVTHRESGYN